MSPDVVQVKISAASMRLPFITCGPACIAAGCKGNCCDAPTRPSGMLVTIHKSEQARVRARGGKVVSGLLQPKKGCRECPFKAEGLCTLHGTPDKPFGCIASPFTVNKNGTLIVRNRYKMLPCYKGKGTKRPAYTAFFDSLVLMFGLSRAKRIRTRLNKGEGDFIVNMPKENYAMLLDNDLTKKRAG